MIQRMMIARSRSAVHSLLRTGLRICSTCTNANFENLVFHSHHKIVTFHSHYSGIRGTSRSTLKIITIVENIKKDKTSSL
jgi:hypothetical protein